MTTTLQKCLCLLNEVKLAGASDELKKFLDQVPPGSDTFFSGDTIPLKFSLNEIVLLYAFVETRRQTCGNPDAEAVLAPHIKALLREADAVRAVISAWQVQPAKMQFYFTYEFIAFLYQACSADKKILAETYRCAMDDWETCEQNAQIDKKSAAYAARYSYCMDQAIAAWKTIGIRPEKPLQERIYALQQGIELLQSILEKTSNPTRYYKCIIERFVCLMWLQKLDVSHGKRLATQCFNDDAKNKQRDLLNRRCDCKKNLQTFRGSIVSPEEQQLFDELVGESEKIYAVSRKKTAPLPPLAPSKEGCHQPYRPVAVNPPMQLFFVSSPPALPVGFLPPGAATASQEPHGPR